MKWSAISEIITLQITMYVILINFLNGKVNRKAFFLTPLLTINLISILELTNYFIVLFFLFDIFLYFILPTIFIKNIKLKETLYTAISVIGVYSLINTSTSFIATLISPESVSTGIYNIIINIIFTILIFHLSTKKRITEFIVTVLTTSKSVKIVFICFIWELLILVTSLTVLLVQTDTKPIISFTCFIIFIIMIASCIVLYLLIINNLKSMYYKSINSNIENSIKQQVKHYEQLSKANENLRKFKHDFDNLKIGLNTYLKNDNVQGAIHYLEECNHIIEKDTVLVNTGHYILDALFSDKASIAKQNNIEIKLSGILPSDILTPVDLCIIFGNILDNAIESCLKIQNNTTKTINVEISKNHDYVFVSFTNPTLENIEILNNTIPTTKKDSKTHGIGLYSIKQVLAKYDGHLQLSCTNNIFKTEFDFCINSISD